MALVLVRGRLECILGSTEDASMPAARSGPLSVNCAMEALHHLHHATSSAETPSSLGVMMKEVTELALEVS